MEELFPLVLMGVESVRLVCLDLRPKSFLKMLGMAMVGGVFASTLLLIDGGFDFVASLLGIIVTNVSISIYVHLHFYIKLKRGNTQHKRCSQPDCINHLVGTILVLRIISRYENDVYADGDFRCAGLFCRLVSVLIINPIAATEL